jgi:sporulation-control protein spo0M
MTSWNPNNRDPNDPESSSSIEWLEPAVLISLMERQGQKFKRIDTDESEMIKRALPYIQKCLANALPN